MKSTPFSVPLRIKGYRKQLSSEIIQNTPKIEFESHPLRIENSHFLEAGSFSFSLSGRQQAGSSISLYGICNSFQVFKRGALIGILSLLAAGSVYTLSAVCGNIQLVEARPFQLITEFSNDA